MKLQQVERRTIEVRTPAITCCPLMKMMLDERIYIPDYDGEKPQLYWYIKQPNGNLRKMLLRFCFNCGEKIE